MDRVGNIVCRPARVVAPCPVKLTLLWAALCCGVPASVRAQDAANGIDSLPFEPRAPRDERVDDHIAAATFYAHARLLQLQDQPARALRRYQRAWRYDGDAVAILEQVVPLAQSLGRHHEAARYAVFVALRSLDDANLLTQLGHYLVEQGDARRAAALFEKALDLRRAGALDSRRVSLQIELGRLSLSFGESDEADRCFQEVRAAIERPQEYGMTKADVQQLLSQQQALYSTMGDCFLTAERFDDATDMFRRANTEKPDEATLSYNLARVAFSRKEFDAAREQLDVYFATKASTAGTAPYELLEEILQAGGELSEEAANAQSCNMLRRLHEQDPQNAPLGYALAGLLFERAEVQAARELYLKLLNASAASSAYQRLAEIASRQQDAGLLLQVAGQAIAASESLDVLAADDGERFPEQELLAAAIEQAKREAAAAVNARNQREAVAAALFAVRVKDKNSVRQLLAAALRGTDISPSKVRETVGLELFMYDQYALAGEVFRAAIDDEDVKEKPRFYFYLSGALEIDGRTDEALVAAEKVAKLRDDLPSFRIRPAWVLYHAKRYEEARRRYQSLLSTYDANQTSPDARETARDIRYVLSNICASQGKQEEAVEWLEQILDEFPEDSGALNDLGYLWADRGEHLHRALQMVQAAVASDPDSAAYRDSLGWAYYRLGRFDEAVRELEAAAESTPDGVILDHLGDAYAKAGRRSDALKTWTRAADAYDKSKDVDAARQVTLKINEESVQ